MQEIIRKITIQTGNSERSINQLNKEIKELSDELNGLTINSKRYTEVSKELAIRQKELTSINQTLEVASRTTQKRFENLQKFSTGLTAGFTTLASTFALLGADSENFDKTITKLTGSLAILQSVGGLKDLIESFPGVIAGFKNIGDSIKRFFTGAINSFDPLERRLSEAAGNLKNIGKIDIQADIKTGGIESKASGDIAETNKQLDAQQRAIAPLADQWSKYNKQIKAFQQLQSQFASQAANYAQQVKAINQQEKEWIKQLTLLNAKRKSGAILSRDEISRMSELNIKLRGIAAARATATEGYQKFNSLSQAATRQIEILGGRTEALEKQMKAAGIAVNSFGNTVANTLKLIGKSAILTVVISTIVGLIYKLVDYIKTLKSAAKEQREFNKAINQTTSELSSSKLAKFYELQKAFIAIGDSAEAKKKFLEDYSEQLKETGLAITDTKTAEEAFINNTDKYVQAIIARAKIDAYREQITKKTQETLEKNFELERKIEEGRISLWQSFKSALLSPDLKESDEKYRQENIDKWKKEIAANNQVLDKQISGMVGNIADLTKEFSGLWASTTDGAKKTGNTVKAEITSITDLINDILDKDDFLDRFDEYQKLIQDITFGPGETEFSELQEWYNNAIDLYKQYGGDLEQLEEEYNKRYTELKDKYYKKQAEDAKKAREQELQGQITAVKELYDYQTKQLTLYKPKTTYNQLGLTFQYQSGSDVKKEYENTIDYNNQIYNLTAERIAKENAIYNKQLENSQLTADEKLNIERKLAENTKALQDAELQRDQDNTQAAIDLQRKKLQAFQATAQVTSSVLGSLGTVFDTKAQLAKTEKEQKKAAETAKGFKAAQAVIDALSAANGAYSSMSSIPYVGPALGAAAAAAALIAGYANVKQILAQDVSGSTIQQATGTPASVNVPAVSYTRNLVGDKELDEINKPQVCLVVEDLNQVQNRMQVRESNATF